MKIHTAICFALIVAVLLCGCNDLKNGGNMQKTDFVEAMWVSYLEIDNMLKADFKQEYKKMLKNAAQLGITDLFVHIRPFSDSLYESSYFPLRQTAKAVNFDIVEFMVNETHKSNMRFHAWINPYRVKTADSIVETLNKNNPAYAWLTDDNTENDINVSVYNGIYLNPASIEVRKLVVDSIRELITLYDIDGIHFDDYFYPTTDEAFDSEAFSRYKDASEVSLELGDWRRANINALITAVKSAIKYIKPELIFSISPAASIDKNYSEYYADIEFWCQNGMLDWIIPQLYFGFEYPLEEFRFNTLIKRWSELELGEGVKLIIGLGAYKYIEPTESDGEEWSQNPDLLSRQYRLCRNTEAVDGCAYYSYTSLFNANENSQKILSLLKRSRQSLTK